ncbi:MAG: hypothetical protein AB7M93_26180 [Candidatus Obscuribacterales bacterium]
MEDRADVLLFVEDPGACNYLKDVPGRLADSGIRAALLATGAGVEYLNSRQGKYTEIAPDADVEALLENYGPDLVIVGTSETRDSLAHKLVDRCRREGIVSVGAVDMEANAEHRFRGLTETPLAHAPDWLLVPDESCKKEYERLGFPGERAVIAGHPHFDFVRSVATSFDTALRRDILGSSPDERRIVTFICEGYDQLNRSATMRSPEYTLFGRGDSEFRTVIVLEELIDAIRETQPRPFLVMRLHPKMTDEVEAYEEEVDYVSRRENPLELLAASDLVVGMTSMLLHEAAIMGKPTLSVLPRAMETIWLPTTASGFTRAIFDRDELRAFFADLESSLAEIERADRPAFVMNALDNITAFIEAKLASRRLSPGTCDSPR